MCGDAIGLRGLDLEGAFGRPRPGQGTNMPDLAYGEIRSTLCKICKVDRSGRHGVVRDNKSELKRVIRAVHVSHQTRCAAYRGMFGEDPPVDGALRPTVVIMQTEKLDGQVHYVMDTTNKVSKPVETEGKVAPGVPSSQNRECSGASTGLRPEEGSKGRKKLLEDIMTGKRMLEWLRYDFLVNSPSG